MPYFRTDLAVEEMIEGVEKRDMRVSKMEKVDIKEEDVEKYHKKKGAYYTLLIDELKDDLAYDLADVLREIYQQLNINDCGLIIGLGNRNITPDSLGPLVVERVIVTKHLIDMGEKIEGMRNISVMAPGVMGQTGMETSAVIEAVCDKTKPSFIIVVDALASYRLNRVNRTIQITTSGINPGSGVGNKRKEISKDVLGIPVIAIGVPTVVDVASVANDVMEEVTAYLYHELVNKNPLIPNNPNIDVPLEEKKNFLGMIGTLNESDLKALLKETLTQDYMVTPKSIDEDMLAFANIMAKGINLSLHEANIDKIGSNDAL